DDREKVAAVALKRAEAVAREYNTNLDLKLVRARTLETAILELVTLGDYDMVILSAFKDEFKKQGPFIVETEKLLKSAPCRVLVSKTLRIKKRSTNSKLHLIEKVKNITSSGKAQT